ncbi:MAG: M13 family metallopeptidase [Chitinophagaceae bacterium]
MKPNSLIAPIMAAAGICLFACNENSTVTTASRVYLDTSAMNTSIKPGDNFFLYVNGKWIDKTTIPASESDAGSFLDLYNNTKDNLHHLLDSISTLKTKPGSIEQKVADYYASGMDTTTIEKRGYDPVKPILAEIDAIKDPAGVMKFVTEQDKNGNGLLFNGYVGADDKNSAMNIAVFSQGGLGLPDRDYYFKTDPANEKVVSAYKTYLQKLFTLTGDDSVAAEKKVMAIYALEKNMASSHKTNVQLRDPESNYHMIKMEALAKTDATFDWKNTLAGLGMNTDSVNVQQPEFYAKLNELLKTTPIDTWKDYLRAHTLSNYANALSSPFVQASFDFYNKALSGQSEMKPRWDKMVRSTDGNLGEALGQLYVERYFTADAKKRMLDMVNNLETAFEARIGKLDWMSDSTKAIAKDKLHAFLKKIGYPDKWRDYSKVDIDKTKFFENRVSAAKNEYDFNINKLGKPVDKMEWGMTPPTINAYYNPSINEIVFPAGILQFPFFDPNADDAINYGGIGMVIGHEMTHGFDDQGAQYDKNGNLKNWWSAQDNEKFKAKTKEVNALYNSFTILDSLHVNGELTTGENMADIGGICIAYDAFKMTKEGQDTTKIDGFTPDQRFFISFAQIWRSKEKDEYARMLINVDPHSPPMYRVNGPLMNFTPFYTAFNVQPGEKMYVPEDKRIKIW